MEGETTAVSTQKRSRLFYFTINNWQTLENGVIEHLVNSMRTKAKYYVWGEEKGENGTPHLQGFVWFKNQLVFNTVKAIFRESGAHIGTCNGTAHENMLYCKKGEQPKAEWELQKSNGPTYGKNAKITEWGVPPVSAAEKGELGATAQQLKWTEIKDDAIAGKLDEVLEKYPREAIQSWRTLKLLKNEFRSCPKSIEVLDNYWFYGDAGCGKTRRTIRTYGESLYDHDLTKWWDGYDGEDTVLFDDLAPWHKELGSHLKRWAGNNSSRAEYKGGMLMVRPKRYVVTSQYRIDQIWEDKETRDAIHRRFQEVEVLLEEEKVIWESEKPIEIGEIGDIEL